MFNINYETAKAEVARRHERLVEAQRTGYAYEPRRPHRPLSTLFAAVAARFGRKASAAGTPVTSSGDPCLTC